ncbi:MAG: gamma-glutamyltransferase [Actinomycetota bacterium]
MPSPADALAFRATGRRWAVATPHAAATRSAARAFAEGGTAVDAALAAATSLAVVYPHMCGVGGDLFALVREPDGQVVAINSSGAAPAAIDPDAVRASHDRMPEHGPLAVTVPGAVAGWAMLHGEGADLPWRRLFDDPIAQAREGVPIARSLAASIAWRGPRLADDPGLAAVFTDGGRGLTEGEALRQPALAATLEAIAATGADAIYGGDVGTRYAAGLRAAGSPIARQDLIEHEAELGGPLRGRFRDLDVLVVPPNSQGWILPLILAGVERLGLDPDPLGPDAAMLAALFLTASQDRDRHNADPRGGGVRIDALLDEGHVADVAESARDALDHATRQASPTASIPDRPGGDGDGDTIALVTADAHGRAVCLIQSLYDGFGAQILEPSTGIIAHNRGACFVLDPASRNVLAPRKRPAHTLMPAMLTRDGELAFISGTKGGAAQPQINALNILRSVALGLDPADALAAPRWIVDDTGPDGDTPFIRAEGRVPPAVREALASTGLEVVVDAEVDEDTGHAHLIAAGDAGFTVAADPRSDGAAEAG